MSKMHLALDQSLEKSIKARPEKQDRYISNHDIGEELNIDHNKTVLNHLEKSFGEDWIQKKTRCLGAT